MLLETFAPESKFFLLFLLLGGMAMCSVLGTRIQRTRGPLLSASGGMYACPLPMQPPGAHVTFHEPQSAAEKMTSPTSHEAKTV